MTFPRPAQLLAFAALAWGSGCTSGPSRNGAWGPLATASPGEAHIVLSTQQPAPARPQPASNTLHQLAATVADGALPAESRANAARLLLSAGEPALPLLDVLMSHDDAARILLQAATQTPTAAATLLLALDLSQVTEEQAIVLIDRTGEERSKLAARALVRMLDGSSRVAEAAARGLARSTGASDKTQVGDWRDWWLQRQNVEPERWTGQLLDDLVDRTQSLERRQQRLDRMVLDTYRRLYIITPPESRSALLAELLESDQTPVRDLGFELADRELSANATLDAAVASRAIALLSDPSPQARAAAARLINRLAPPDARVPITQALVAETNPIAAEALLAAAARWPGPEIVEPALHWMGTRATAGSACQAGLALLDRGLITQEEHLERVRAALLPLPAEPSAARLQLLNLIGEAPERQAIAELLTSDVPRVRQTAADTLARLSDSARLLLQRAADDESVAPLALLALASHGRLAMAELASLPLKSWDEAFSQATSVRVKALLATSMLARAGAQLTEERKAELQAAIAAAGG
ncbi:MAG: hypothetical protein KJZ65_03545 [Phycisphaerales bacterium]|nr:hypothetical protein [Phycisphaerales bacterium]